VRLHIGSGPISLPGWTNIDIAPWPGVDLVFDIKTPWPFADVDFIFAEHFIEHLTLLEGHNFLLACRAALRPAGVLRLSTPNLDWVWLTHYKLPSELSAAEQMLRCLEMNRAFHGWGHQFLYNQRMLELSLRAAGFAHVEPQEYGQSSHEELRGLERHERHVDHSGAPSLVIVDASGIGEPSSSFIADLDPYLRDFAAK
jgi:predicted SAM-dependent methyltransferase